MMLRLAKWSFLLLVVFLPLVRPLNYRFADSVIPATDFIFPVVFLFWAAALVFRQTSLRLSRFYLFLFFYFAAMTLSTVFSADFDRSAIKLAGEFYLLALAVLTFNLVRDERDLRHISWAWMIGTVLTIGASLVGFALFYAGYKTQANNFSLFQYGTLPVGNFPRMKALFENANMACNYLNVSLILVLIAAEIGWLKKLPSLVLQAGIWFVAFFAFSPGIGGMFLAQGLWNWAKYRKTNNKFAFASLFIGISLAFALFAASVVHPDTANTDQDWRLPVINYTIEPAARPIIWQQALTTISRNPVFGKGLNTDAANLRYTTLSDEVHSLGDAHNTFLSVASQTGFVGFTAFTLLLIFLLRTFLPIRFERQTVIKTGLGFAFVTAFLYQGLAGSFEDARHLWVLIGLMASFGEREQQEENIA
ncbi:MAG TPA: O-antigen ligase family protein [Pyrinomonadaceae bacterium]|nr:O-antigen ligase family protein [Pyrinomonadaceae bacterium]